MDNIEQRNYYKIFTGTNQSEGYDKIHLGYEAETTEIKLPKDTVTYFHVPFFADSQNIQDSTLIADGASPGPIPALADRIYKKLGDYGERTPWGTTTDRADGTWLCSWLYAVSSEPPQWLDRYYNPGRLAYTEALEGRANFTDYLKNDPIYYDIPSTLTLEPGVLYQYFHQGEKTAINYLQTFAGDNKDRLRLDIDDWSATPLDQSIYNNSTTITNFNTQWVKTINDPGYTDRNVLNFDNTDFINCKVLYSDSYNLQNEFTLSFWIYHEDWSQATSTQLVGNLQKGGYGIFYNNLYDNPFFVVPENTYGHLFYFNQEGNIYTDKNVQFPIGENADPAYVNINSNNEVISIDSKNNRVIKYNHVGDAITYSSPLSGETLKLAIIDKNDNTFVVTTSGLRVYDKDLTLISQNLSLSSAYGYKELLAFDADGNLVRELSCLDVKFTENNQKWVIKENNTLYLNNNIISSLSSVKATNIAVDPNNYIWVLADSNIVHKIDPDALSVISTFTIGVKTDNVDLKNIGFIKKYNRSTNSFEWLAIIYHSYEKTLYFANLQGNILDTVFLPEKLNILDPATSIQNSELLSFTGKGDFTGYERKRIFNKALYNNNPQIQFKIAATPTDINLPYTIYNLSVPVQYFVDKTWHLITATYKNRTMSLYVDNYLRDTLTILNNTDLNYEFKNDLFIGCPCGKADNLNKDINSTSIIWNGYIDSIKIYDYCIDSKLIEFFLREKILADNIQWNIPTSPLQYVEVIDRFFKHRQPGSKSVFFNIKLTGAKITDFETKKQIETDIKLAIEQIKPAYAELLRVEWID